MQDDLFSQITQEIPNERAEEIITTTTPSELKKLAEDIESKKDSEDQAEINDAIRKADELIKPEKIIEQLWSDILDKKITAEEARNQLPENYDINDFYVKRILDQVKFDKYEIDRKAQTLKQRLDLTEGRDEYKSQNLFQRTEEKKKELWYNNIDELTPYEWDNYARIRRKQGYDVKNGDDGKRLLEERIKRTNRPIVDKEVLDAFNEARGTYQKEIKPTEDSKRLFQTAKKVFGTTLNRKEAGYILPDGSMLDFSGKREGGTANIRAFDHREITRLYEKGISTNMEDFILNGAIRYMPEKNGFYIKRPPTPKQRNLIAKILQDNNGYGIVEVGQGLDVFYKEYNKGTKPSEVLRDIDNYFSFGKSKSKIAEIRNNPEFTGEGQELLQRPLNLAEGRTDLQNLQDRKRHLELSIKELEKINSDPEKASKYYHQNNISPMGAIIQAETEIKSINSKLGKVRAEESQFDMFGDKQNQMSLFRKQHQRTRNVYEKMQPNEQKRFNRIITNAFLEEYPEILQNKLSKDRAAAKIVLDEMMKLSMTYDPRTADIRSAIHEANHIAMLQLIPEWRAKRILQENGWDGKGDYKFWKGNKSLEDAYENFAKANEEWYSKTKEYKGKPLTERFITFIKELWNKIAAFLHRRGFYTQAGFFENLYTGRMKEMTAKELSGRLQEINPKIELAPESSLGQSFSPTWYNKLERVVEQKAPNKNIEPNSLLAMLKNNGVKDEEIKWLDIEGFLRENPKATKEGLLDYIRANNVEIKELFQRIKSKEEIPEKINVDGIERPTRDSKGRLIHPTEKGIRNFWKGFTNSQVVDEQGKPIPLYSGHSNTTLYKELC